MIAKILLGIGVLLASAFLALVIVQVRNVTQTSSVPQLTKLSFIEGFIAFVV